jgi:4Fe-4S ferredoxin
MAIYKLLHNINCKQCGEATCYTFALPLSTSQKSLNDCPPLAEAQYAQQRAALDEIIIDAPAIG